MNLLLVLIFKSFEIVYLAKVKAELAAELVVDAVKDDSGIEFDNLDYSPTGFDFNNPSFEIEDDDAGQDAMVASADDGQSTPDGQPTPTQAEHSSALVNLVEHPLFDWATIAIILCNCVTMALETPFLDPDEVLDTRNDAEMLKYLQYLDFAFTVIFTVEAALKVAAYGLDYYLRRDSWNRMDCFVVVVSWLDLLLTQIRTTGSSMGLLKSVRLLRVFRTLRLMSKMEGLQQLVTALANSVMAIVNILVVLLLVWLIFGIFGVAQFKGRFYRCDDTNVYSRAECVGAWCSTSGDIDRASWANTPTSFDNIFSALYLLFEMSVDNWASKAYQGMDATGVDLQPVAGTNPYWSLYFLCFMVVSKFFFMNLLVGTIYQRYVAIHEAGREDLNSLQVQWLLVMRHMPHVKMVRNVEYILEQAETEMLRESTCMYKFVTSKRFEQFMLFVIVFNCLVMGVKYRGEPQWWADTQLWLNFGCTVIFTVEAGLKIVALGPDGYFTAGKHRFDFLVCAGSWLDFCLFVFDVTFVNTSVLRTMRILVVIGRAGRTMKAWKSIESLQQIFDTALMALPQVLHITILILLIIFTFAVVGMNMLGRVALQGVYGME